MPSTAVERFSRIRGAEDVLKFVQTYGPLTRNGLKEKGDIVPVLINEAEDMRSRVSKPLGKLNVTILTKRG